jgi:hypothetical protein
MSGKLTKTAGQAKRLVGRTVERAEARIRAH